MGGMKHPFHIHGTQFKVLSVDGKKPPKDMRVKGCYIFGTWTKAKIEVVFKILEHTCFTVIYLSMKIME